ncbi:MAG: hypothetical protein SFW35_03300 [Chitinophagales bacterium]|nr:hypothetical protein [Chitinophagales bacterium]
MGTQTIVYGRIILEDNPEKSIAYLKSLSDENYPWIRAEHFSDGSLEWRYYYDNVVVGFGASYKGLEYDWGSFMLKFENVLRNISFENAKVEMEAEHSFGPYVFLEIEIQRI